MINRIYPCIWFDRNAREAAEFYCTVFGDSIMTWGNDYGVTFELSGQKFMCINGGPRYTINPSISIYVVIEAESEIDRVWNLLSDQGEALMPLDKYPWSSKYGWVRDKYGLTWQVTTGRKGDGGQKFFPLLMFNGSQSGRAEDALIFYTSVFKCSSVISVQKYTSEDNDAEGTVKHAEFRLGSYLMMAMDSSLPHQFGFNEAVSMVVDCKDQKEIDYFWEKFTTDGEEVQSGWLKDKFGVSWQILPEILPELMSDPSRSERVAAAFIKMKKFDIEKLISA